MCIILALEQASGGVQGSGTRIQYRRTALEIFSPLASFLLLSHRSRSQVTGCSSGHDTGCSRTICRSYRSQMGNSIIIIIAFNCVYMTCAVT